jgi:hypothetical protein
MKHIINGFLVGMALCMPVFAADTPRETKKVCVDQKDKAGNPVKDAKGNVKQTCKAVKQHKKLEPAKP